MRPISLCLALATVAPLLGGCIARTAVDIVTAPVRATAQVVDWTTTSQDEADRNRGRALREREEQLGRLARRQQRAAERCADGNRSACEEAQSLNQQMEQLRDAPLPR